MSANGRRGPSTRGAPRGGTSSPAGAGGHASANGSSERGRLLSTPKVTTQNNQQAEIKQGVQIPIQTVANNTVTVQFKDAALKLVVTPQITAADTVIMRIRLENGVPQQLRHRGTG